MNFNNKHFLFPLRYGKTSPFLHNVGFCFIERNETNLRYFYSEWKLILKKLFCKIIVAKKENRKFCGKKLYICKHDFVIFTEVIIKRAKMYYIYYIGSVFFIEPTILTNHSVRTSVLRVRPFCPFVQLYLFVVKDVSWGGGSCPSPYFKGILPPPPQPYKN